MFGPFKKNDPLDKKLQSLNKDREKLRKELQALEQDLSAPKPPPEPTKEEPAPATFVGAPHSDDQPHSSHAHSRRPVLSGSRLKREEIKARNRFIAACLILLVLLILLIQVAF